MVDNHPTGEELLAKIRSYNAYMEGGKADEARADEMIGELDALVPHANISDLMFWGERERSDEEIASEALLRERLWHNGGELALLMHLRSQFEKTLGDPSVKPVHKNYAAQMLETISVDIQQLQDVTRH